MVEWKVGDAVQFNLEDAPDQEEGGEPVACAIGIIGKIEDVTAYVVEVHAFHRYWGGSNACRGRVKEVPLAMLEICTPAWRHIIKENKNKAKITNVLDELMAPSRV